MPIICIARMDITNMRRITIQEGEQVELIDVWINHLRGKIYGQFKTKGGYFVITQLDKFTVTNKEANK